jgi:hypothetical protein
VVRAVAAAAHAVTALGSQESHADAASLAATARGVRDERSATA